MLFRSELVVQRVTILDLLSNDKLDGEVLLSLQAQDCIEDATFESTTIQHCNKFDKGYGCMLDVKTYEKQVPYTLYTPVNYHDIQLNTGGKKSYFVTDKDNKWRLLHCLEDTDNQLNMMDLCSVETYENDCSRSFHQEKMDNFIKYCNFTRITALPYIITVYGVLIQQEHARITLITPATTNADNSVIPESRLTLTNPVPILVQTNKMIEIVTDQNTFVIPSSLIYEHEFTTGSWLTESDISWLKSSMFTHELLGAIELGGWVDVGIISVIAAIISVIFYLVRTVRSQLSNTMDIADVRSQIKQHKRNLKENKAFIKMSGV